MPSSKFNVVDPDDTSFTVACYRGVVSQAQSDARRLRRLRNYSQIQEKMADPMEAYFYEKEQNDIAAAKRAGKNPKNSGKTFRELLHEVQLRSNHDRMPIILKKVKKGGGGKTLQRKMVKNTRGKQSNRFQKQLEANADAGLLMKTLFDAEFIKSVKNFRKNKGITQAALALLINVRESEIRSFERNELVFDSSLKALLTAQLTG